MVDGIIVRKNRKRECEKKEAEKEKRKNGIREKEAEKEKLKKEYPRKGS